MLPPKTVLGGTGGWPPQETRTGRARPDRRERAASSPSAAVGRARGAHRSSAAGVGLGHLLARVALVEERVRALVEHRRADDPAPDDPFRGLYLTDETSTGCSPAARRARRATTTAAREVEQAADAAEAAGAGPGCARLAARRRPDRPGRRAAAGRAGARPGQPVRAALRLPQRRRHPAAGDDRAGAGAGRRVRPLAAAPAARLDRRARRCSTGLLVTVEDADRPFLTRALRVPDRVAAHLLGDDDAGRRRWPTLLADAVPSAGARSDDLARALRRRAVRLVYVRERGAGTGAGGRGRRAARRSGARCWSLDLAGSRRPRRRRSWSRVLGREALLRGARAGRRAGRGAGRRRRRRRCAGWPTLPVPVVLVGDGDLGPELDRRRAAGWSTSPAPRPRPTGSRCGDRELGADGRDADGDAAGHRPLRARPRPGGRARSRPRGRPRCCDGALDGRRPAARRPRAERRRAGAAGPADRAGGRLGRPRAAADGAAASCTTWPPGPGTATRC